MANISNTKIGSIVTGTSDADSIYNRASFATIDGGGGNDTINVPYAGGKESVNGGAGDDSIFAYDRWMTITGGTGNDTINIDAASYSKSYLGDWSNIMQYGSGDGNDVMIGWHESDTIQLTDLSTSAVSKVSLSGNDVVVKIGSGSIKFKDAKDRAINFMDSAQNFRSIAYSNGNTLNVTYNTSSKAKINGTNDVDFIYNQHLAYLSNINSGAGNDIIRSDSYETSINAGEGNDLIYVNGTTSIIGGKGNDTITLHDIDNLIQYAAGDGDDVYIIDYVASIYGGANSFARQTVQITDGSSYSTTASGDDLKIKVGDGSMLIKNAKGTTISISGGTYTEGDTEKPLPTGLTYNKAKTALTASKKFTGSEIDLTGYASTVVTLNAASAKNGQNLIGNDKNNVIKGTAKADTLLGGKGDDTLTGGKGNDLFIYDGQGSDVITDYTAGQDTVMIADNQTITGSKLSGKDVILTVGNKTADSIGTITLKNGKGKVVRIVKSMSDTPLSVIYGDNAATISVSNSDVETIKGYNDNINVVGLINKIDASKRSKVATFIGDLLHDNNITGGKGNDLFITYNGDDSVNGGAGNDTLDCAYGYNTLTGGKGKDVFICSGGEDTITDYTAGQDRIELTNNFTGVSVSGKDLIFTNNIGSLTLLNAVTKDKKGNINGKKITITDAHGITTSQVYGVASLSVANSDGETIDASSTVNKDIVEIVDASKRNAKNPIVIVGNSLNNTLKGGAGEDTIIAGSGDDLLTGGKGKDLFVYSAGKDTITDYAVGQDTIKLNVGSAANYTVSGKDVIFNIDEDNYLTVKNAKDKVLTVIDSTGTVEDTFNDVTEKVFAKSDKDASYDATNDTAVTLIDATKKSTKIYITGNDNDNTIKGSAKDDTLAGGKGADLLTGGKGKDLFIYDGQGDDTITDYTAGQDKIQIDAFINSASVSGNDVVISTGNWTGSLTIKNGKGKKLTIIDKDGYTETGVFTEKTSTAYYTDASDDFYSITIYCNMDASKRKNDIWLISTDGGDSILKGGSGSDFIASDYNSDTLTGGKGNDTFQCAGGGDDVITDYTVGQDILLVSANYKVTTSKVSGKDVVLTVGSEKNSSLGSITLKKASGKQISITNDNLSETPVITQQIFGANASTLVATSNTDLSELTNIDLVKMVDTSKAKASVTITNNSTAHTIKGSSYADNLISGSGGDTLIGGKGADNVTLGGGANVFVYTSGDGDDVIVDFTSADKIKLGSKKTAVNESKSSVSGSDYVITIGKNTITLKDAASTPITVVDYSGASKVYNSQESAFTEIFADDNFNSSDLSEIISTNNLIDGDYNFDSVQNKFTSNKITDLTHSTKK